jgi:hypothetical protein
VRRTALALALALALTSGAQPSEDPRAEAVVEAAFRQQVGFWLDDDTRQAGTVVCLAVEKGGVAHSVSREYVARFRDPSLRRAAECEERRDGPVERLTGRPAVLVTVGAIAWMAPDDAWVWIRSRSGRHSRSAQQFRVVREPSRWICLGPVLKTSPA